jgi:hypothetical protein
MLFLLVTRVYLQAVMLMVSVYVVGAMVTEKVSRMVVMKVYVF